MNSNASFRVYRWPCQALGISAVGGRNDQLAGRRLRRALNAGRVFPILACHNLLMIDGVIIGQFRGNS